MQISSLELPGAFLRNLQERGIEKLNPPQEAAVDKGLLELKKSFVIAAPTASGKTLMAEMLISKTLLEKKGKALYIVPLRALANEKYESFKQRFQDYRVGISTGDYDSSDNWLRDYDIVVLTAEKTDSILRHKAQWIEQTAAIVIDEVHLLNDPSRGPTLEMVITNLRKLCPRAVFLFLSATIKNSKDLSGWIDGELVKSEWRPVKLYQGVYDGEKVQFQDREPLELDTEKDPEVSIAEKTAKEGKQSMIFASTRRSAESIAERSALHLSKILSPEEKIKLEKLAAEVEKVLETPTKQCHRLAECVRGGTAFHHAGLTNTQRKAIEQAFRDRIIKSIASTPTLSAGLDLPCFRAVIRDCKRYYQHYGYTFIPVLEYQQMIGRAGRPSFDKWGESILIAKDKREARELYEKFVMGEAEEIYSKLAAEPVLRMHTLSLIASETVKSETDLLEVFSKTFYAHQFGKEGDIEGKLSSVLGELADWGFIIRIGQELKPTTIGKRVSQLYIDPETAHYFLDNLSTFPSSIGLLQLISSAKELSPALSVYSRELEAINELVVKRNDELLIVPPEDWSSDYDSFLETFKTALFFEDWCTERTEEELNVKYKISPGEIHGKRELADWLLYSLSELALLSQNRDAEKSIRKLRVRMKYGVKEELLPLVKLKGIGRIRARRLWASNLRGIAELKKAPEDVLERILGAATARAVKGQVQAGSE
ncbi:MAG: DEAD/DEAH box helicase [Candidatus Aenigmarchaeota archaeon]|nr:DEAD/DEAH box helicase [Candidatus Aenigmarchaeota archaeon]